MTDTEARVFMGSVILVRLGFFAGVDEIRIYEVVNGYSKIGMRGWGSFGVPMKKVVQEGTLRNHSYCLWVSTKRIEFIGVVKTPTEVNA